MAHQLQLEKMLTPIDSEGVREDDPELIELVARAQAGDHDAFAAIYDRYFDQVYAYLHVALKGAEEAQDGAQQVFMQVLEALPRYRHRDRPFKAWLFVIARNYAVSRLRKLGREELSEPPALDRHRRGLQSEEAELRTMEWITDRDLLIFVERLPLAQRQVLFLRFMLDLSLSQAAEILGRTPNDVAALQHRAVGFLRERLAAVGRAPERHGGVRMRAWLRPAQVLRRRRSALIGS